MGGEMQTRREPPADREYKQNDWTSHRHGGDDRHEKKVPAAREHTHRQSDRQTDTETKRPPNRQDEKHIEPQIHTQKGEARTEKPDTRKNR